MMQAPVADIVIAGGGIIGLSLGLELLARGLTVTVIERNQAMSSASWAAGGMLAVMDPQNPPQLMPLSVRSRELYPAYLASIESRSGHRVPLRTRWTLQQMGPGHPCTGALATTAEIEDLAPGLRDYGHRLALLEEGSLDPNDLREALPAAFVRAGGTLIEAATVVRVESTATGVIVQAQQERCSLAISAGMFVNCCGAWAGEPSLGGLPVMPVKGQMVNLRCKPERLLCVVRTPGIYLMPRGDGRVTVGATVEYAGFDETVRATSIQPMIEAALRLLPEAETPEPLDQWAGLRPGTPDGLPILGRASEENCWHATGHYRDGILLAPVTARILAQAMLGERPDVPLDDFAPARFSLSHRASVDPGAPRSLTPSVA